MTPLFQKLNFKNHAEICVLNAPESFDGEMLSMRGTANVLTSLEACSKINFILAFVTAKEEVERLVPIINAKLNGDAIVWFAYVKGTSKRYKSDINRDNGWQSLEIVSMIPVRGVAIDDDWSALRFRKIEFIKKITRKV